MQYYERLKGIREDSDKTQKEIADLIQTSQSYYAQYENGKRPIPFDRLIIIADYFNVSLDWIAGRTDKRDINT